MRFLEAPKQFRTLQTLHIFMLMLLARANRLAVSVSRRATELTCGQAMQLLGAASKSALDSAVAVVGGVSRSKAEAEASCFCQARNPRRIRVEVRRSPPVQASQVERCHSQQAEHAMVTVAT